MEIVSESILRSKTDQKRTLGELTDARIVFQSSQRSFLIDFPSVLENTFRNGLYCGSSIGHGRSQNHLPVCKWGIPVWRRGWGVPPGPSVGNDQGRWPAWERPAGPPAATEGGVPPWEIAETNRKHNFPLSWDKMHVNTTKNG